MGTLNIAHRGASAAEPENTLRAFQRAIETGADMIQCDIRYTADGIPVVVHGATVRLPDGITAPVNQLEFSLLCTVSAGAGLRIPAFEEVLTLTRKQIGLVIDLKVSGLETPIAELIAAAGPEKPFTVISFLPEVTRRMAMVAPEIPTSLIMGGRSRDLDSRDWLRRRNPLAARKRARADGIFLHKDRLDPPLLKKITQAGIPLAIWTVDDEEEMRLLIDLGVDGIVTNRPELLARILRTG